jgi:DMSO/TMAO reductase YedYZ molybdopterin-dependent catalytic subunit
MTRRSLLWAAAAAASVVGIRQWLVTRPEDEGVPWPLRRMLEWNERLARDYYSTARLSPEFARAAAREPRPNGDVGLPDDFDPDDWTLSLEGLWGDGGETAAKVTLDQIKALPRVEMVTELRCIEGWTQVVHWGGARLSDLMAIHPPVTRSGNPPDARRRTADLPEYVSLETPDGGYYVGLEMASALHPQTLLAYEMNGQPLALEHGAPLRLAIPVKYGIKNIKRIGTIRFTNKRPADYWAERGYDWYAGH